MYGYIYITTNLINNKQYIGKHKSESFDENYKGSGTALKQSFEKYGWENFECHIIKECNDLDELNYWENYYTKQFDAVKSKEFYNLKEGGDGGGNPGCRYMTNGTDCKKVLLEDIDEYLQKGYYFGGPKQSEETKIKRANANRGKKHPTAGEKISKSLTGKKLSEEHKQKLSASHKGITPINCRTIMCIETEKVYKSLHDAVTDLGYKSSGNLCSCLKGNRPTAFGYHWKYID